MVYINVPDMNDSIGRITLGSKEYYIRFTYNPSGGYWSFGIYDPQLNPIVSMIKIVPNFPLLRYYVYSDLPPGIIGCVSNVEKVGRQDFVNGKAKFVYISYEELLEARALEGKE